MLHWKHLLLLSLLLLAACNSAATPVPTVLSATIAPATAVPLPTATLPPAPTATVAPTAAATTAPTATRIPTFVVSGIVYFDLNGNDIRDAGEPPISNVSVRVGDLESVTDAEGKYLLSNVAGGKQDIRFSGKGFSYVSGKDSFQALDQRMTFTVDRETRRDWGLMQGWLTLPFKCDAAYKLNVAVDLDYKLGSIRTYAGPLAKCPTQATCDQHQGIDWTAPEGTPILAMAPGEVLEVYDADDGKAKFVRLIHKLGDQRYVSDYGHNSANLVKRGDKVSRGQVIARVGHTGTSDNHIHFNFWNIPPEAPRDRPLLDWVFKNAKYPIVRSAAGTEMPAVLDPYRDVSNPSSVSLWTRDNDPQCIK